ASSSASGGHETLLEVLPAHRAPRRFHATAKLNPLRISRDAAQIAEEIVQRLAGVVDTDVEVTVEIQARTPEGFPSDVVRAVSENGHTLKLESFGFEEQ
ncbi:MAG: hypothetical protein ACYDCB_07700, partial [Candidatus Dormibacteria bacterium]